MPVIVIINSPYKMLTHVNPKLPMRNKAATKDFYITLLGFEQFGGDYDGYLMVQKDHIQIHFFEHTTLDPKENYGQVYIRTNNIEDWYKYITLRGVKALPPEHKPWRQIEFSLLDPDNNLLTFGQSIE